MIKLADAHHIQNKWPAFICSGEPVTKKQAGIIIVRTNGYHIFSNDKDWENLVLKAFNLPPRLSSNSFSTEQCMQNITATYKLLEKELGVLHLDYMGNDQVASCYVGGPHGWCNWDGTIKTKHPYNVGKYPSTEELYRDWVKIAEAFSFLSLTAQYGNGEFCEKDRNDSPILQFIIDKGSVFVVEPTDWVKPMIHSDIFIDYSLPNRERGTSYERLVEAVKNVRNTIK